MKEMKPLVSIIIPVYKDVPGLEKTINSLKLQTLPPDQYEIIVVNDGGEQAIADFCAHEGIKMLEVKPNQGSYNARNEGIKAVTSDYLALIDAGIEADTKWLKNGVMHLRNFDYVAGDVKIIESLVVDIATFHDYLTAFPMKSYFNEFGFGGAGNLFIKRKVLDMVGGFDHRLRSGGDLEFGNRVSSCAMLNRHFAEDCIVFHPPRYHHEKVEKIRRVMNGHKALLALDKKRFAFLKKKKNLSEQFKAFLPPSWKAVGKIYEHDPRFSKWQLYLYMYKLKLIKCSIVRFLR